MSVSMVSGARGTANVLANQLVIDMEDKIHLLDPDATPLATLLRGSSTMAKEFVRPNMYNGLTIQTGSIFNPKAEWLEDQMNPRTDTVNYSTGYSTTATTLVVSNGAYFVAGQTVMNARTKEVIRVTDVTSNTLTVTRNLNADGSGMAILDTDELVVLGDAEAEGATSPTANTTHKTALFNYSQIFRRAFEVTGTQQSTKQYGGPDLAWQRAKQGVDHSRDLEWSLFFGQRSINTGGAQPIRTMGGAQYYISSNVTDVNANLTEGAFITWLRGVFDAVSGQKFVFASPIVMDAIAGFARGKLLTSIKDETYGLAIFKYVLPHGEVMLVRQPVFKGSTQNIGGYAVCLDMKNVQLAYLEGRSTKLRTNIQAPDADTEKDEYLTEATAKFYNEQTHGILKRVTG